MSIQKSNYAQIFSSHDAGVAHNVHIPKSQKASWDAIKNSHVGNYYETTLLRAVLRLAVGDKTVAPQASIGEFSFSYTTSPDRKDIYIHLISAITTTLTSKTPGIYKAEWDKDKWIIPQGSAPVSSMNLNHSWSDNSHVAAISGKFDNKERAANMMGVHIENAYIKGGNALSSVRQQGNHFSLFWLNNEFTSKDHIQSLVSMIQQAQKQSKNMKWLIHGESCGTFVQALRFIKANPITSDLLTAHKGMSGQDVFFSNPRGRHTSQKELESLCQSVGMSCAGVRINKSDMLLNADARKGLWPLAFAAGTVSITDFSSFLSGEIGADALEKVWNLVSNSPESGVGSAVAIAGGVLAVTGKVVSVSGYFRNLKGVASSTFGSGNQQWAA